MTNITFWTDKIIQQNGLCPASNISTLSSDDLWSDIQDIALEDVVPYLIGGHDFNEMKHELSYANTLFCETERAMLWGLSY